MYERIAPEPLIGWLYYLSNFVSSTFSLSCLPSLLLSLLITDWLVSSFFQARCLAARVELHMLGLAERVAVAMATLSTERSALAVETEKQRRPFKTSR